MSLSKWLTSRLLLLSWAIALGIGALVVTQLLESRAAIWKRAESANGNLLVTANNVLSSTLQQADRGLVHSVSVLEASIQPGPGRLRGLDPDTLFAAVQQNGYGIQLVLDDTGRVLFSSRPTPPGDWVFRHRSYFTVHRDNPDAGFYIGRPFLSSYDGTASVAMSRRWNLPDGSFGGVVVQTWKLSLVHQLFGQLTLDRANSINVFLKDGTLITRYPIDAADIESSFVPSVSFEQFRHAGTGSFRGTGTVDGTEQFHVFGPLEHYPIQVVVSQDASSIVAGWKRNALWLGSATLLLMFACVFLAVFAERQLRAHRRMAERLGRAERELRTIVNSLPVLVAYWDRGLVNRMANIAHLRWIGLAPEQVEGRHMNEVLSEDQRRFLMPHLDAVLAGKTQVYEKAVRGPDGELRYTVTTLIPDGDDSAVKGFFVLATDVTKGKLAEMALVDEKERFRIILDSIKDGVITTDAQGRVLYLNPAAAAMTGWQIDQALHRPVEDVMRVESTDGRTKTVCTLRQTLQTWRASRSDVEHVLVGRSGERQHIEQSASPMLDENGALRGAVVVFHETGSLRAMANKMSHLAQHDALTGLPNRRRLDYIGQRALARARDENQRVAILYLDLDGFKQVNDEHGHATGDDLLIAVTRRLQARLRSGDSLYRQGGDEFVVLMENVADAGDAEQLARRLIDSCQTSLGIMGKQFVVTVSIGISLFPDDDTDLAPLIHRADRGMYEAKNAGRNRYARALTRFEPEAEGVAG